MTRGRVVEGWTEGGRERGCISASGCSCRPPGWLNLLTADPPAAVKQSMTYTRGQGWRGNMLHTVMGHVAVMGQVSPTSAVAVVHKHTHTHANTHGNRHRKTDEVLMHQDKWLWLWSPGWLLQLTATPPLLLHTGKQTTSDESEWLQLHTTGHPSTKHKQAQQHSPQPLRLTRSRVAASPQHAVALPPAPPVTVGAVSPPLNIPPPKPLRLTPPQGSTTRAL
jgi:hypothetical protein